MMVQYSAEVGPLFGRRCCWFGDFQSFPWMAVLFCEVLARESTLVCEPSHGKIGRWNERRKAFCDMEMLDGKLTCGLHMNG